MSEQSNSTPNVTVTFNGETLASDSLWDLVYNFEQALKDAALLESDDTLEILSREASAVASKCGY